MYLNVIYCFVGCIKMLIKNNFNIIDNVKLLVIHICVDRSNTFFITFLLEMNIYKEIIAFLPFRRIIVYSWK